MKQFLVDNWLALLGALAWMPILIEILLNCFRRLHYVYLDKHFIYNATATFNNNSNLIVKKGMVFMIALNLFVYKYPFFPKRIICILKLKNGAKHETKLYEGGLGYTDTHNPPNYHSFIFPDQYNINIGRAIFASQDNIRVLPFFFEDLNMENDENIKEIKIIFSGRFLKKRTILKNDDCEKMNFFSKFDKII